MPTVDSRYVGRAYRHFWSIAARPGQTDPFFHRILHFDHEGAETARDFGRDFRGPRRAALRPGAGRVERGRWLGDLLVYREAEHRSDLYVLRPGDLATVRRLELPHHVPPGFHVTWAPRAPS